MKPAVRLILAYVHATGCYPTHSHLSSWSEASRYVEGVTPKTVKAEALADIEGHHLVTGHVWATSMGFVVAPGSYKRTSHYVAYDHVDGRKLYVSRGKGKGSRWIRVPLENGPPHSRTDLYDHLGNKHERG